MRRAIPATPTSPVRRNGRVPGSGAAVQVEVPERHPASAPACANDAVPRLNCPFFTTPVPPLHTINKGSAGLFAVVSAEPQFGSEVVTCVAVVAEQAWKSVVPLTCILINELLASAPE